MTSDATCSPPETGNPAPRPPQRPSGEVCGRAYKMATSAMFCRVSRLCLRPTPRGVFPCARSSTISREAWQHAPATAARAQAVHNETPVNDARHPLVEDKATENNHRLSKVALALCLAARTLTACNANEWPLEPRPLHPGAYLGRPPNQIPSAAEQSRNAPDGLLKRPGRADPLCSAIGASLWPALLCCLVVRRLQSPEIVNHLKPRLPRPLFDSYCIFTPAFTVSFVALCGALGRCLLFCCLILVSYCLLHSLIPTLYSTSQTPCLGQTYTLPS